MDDGVIIVLDYEKICRLCLQTKGIMSDIFDKDDEVPLTIQIKLVTSVEINPSDPLPKKICHKCRYLVELSHELRSTVLKANQLLRQSGDLDVERLSRALRGDSEYSNVITIEEDEWKGPEDERVVAEEIGDEEGAEEGEGEGEGEELEEEWPEGMEASDWKADTKEKNNLKTEFEYDELTCQLCLEVVHGIDVHLKHVDDHYVDIPELVPFHRCSKPFGCGLCPGQLFSFRKDLIVHHRSHLNITPYRCQVPGCQCLFRSKEALRHHMYSHGEKKFVCEACGAAFRRKFELSQHRVRHQDEGAQYVCKLCRVVCKNRLSFKAHMRHHETGRRFKCTRSGCPKAFFSNTDLRIHERSHSNDKCFKCPLCVCAYISQSQLNRHLRQHEKRRVNKCDKCSESFSDYAEFCNHRIRTHGEWHPHKCPACNQGYQGLRQLQRHVARCRLAGHLDLESVAPSCSPTTAQDEDGGMNSIVNIQDLGLHFKAEDNMEGLSVVMQTPDLQHLTETDGDVCDGNFLYIATAEGGGEGGGLPQYCIIKDPQDQDFLAAVQEAVSIKEERI